MKKVSFENLNFERLSLKLIFYFNRFLKTRETKFKIIKYV